MDKKKEDSPKERGDKMPAIQKKEPEYKGLSKELLDKISITPKAVKDGKIILDKNNKDHRYIMEDDE
ncbi:MAG: hypothetical protein ABFD08_09985 [Syntrophomonas sp.]